MNSLPFYIRIKNLKLHNFTITFKINQFHDRKVNDDEVEGFESEFGLDSRQLVD